MITGPRVQGQSLSTKFVCPSQLRQLRGREQVAAVCYQIRAGMIEFLLVQTPGAYMFRRVTLILISLGLISSAFAKGHSLSEYDHVAKVKMYTPHYDTSSHVMVTTPDGPHPHGAYCINNADCTDSYTGGWWITFDDGEKARLLDVAKEYTTTHRRMTLGSDPLSKVGDEVRSKYIENPKEYDAWMFHYRLTTKHESIHRGEVTRFCIPITMTDKKGNEHSGEACYIKSVHHMR